MSLESHALDRLIFQYRNSPKLEQWISILPALADEMLMEPLAAIEQIIDVDTATGEALNICGRIAGLEDRPTVNSSDLSVFAYDGTPGAQPYGTAPYADPAIAIVSIPLPDYLYRLLVKAKIFKNNSVATIDETKEAVDNIIGGDSNIVDRQDMTFIVYIQEELSDNTRFLIDNYEIIPRPQGVELVDVRVFRPVFAYNGTYGAAPYDQASYLE